MNETLSVTEKKEEHVISPQNKFCPVAFHPHPPFFPPTSPPLLHLGSDDSIGSSFKRISITETVFSLSVQASSHISASLSCLLFHFAPLLFPGRGLLPFYVTSVCVGANPQTGIVSSLAIRRGGLGAEMPAVWERKVRRSADTCVVLGCNKLASCQGNHLVESVV